VVAKDVIPPKVRANAINAVLIIFFKSEYLLFVI